MSDIFVALRSAPLSTPAGLYRLSLFPSKFWHTVPPIPAEWHGLALLRTTAIPSSQGGHMKKSAGSSIVRVALAAFALCASRRPSRRPRRRRKSGFLDDIPAVQDRAPELRLVHPDGEGNPAQRRLFRIPDAATSRPCTTSGRPSACCHSRRSRRRLASTLSTAGRTPRQDWTSIPSTSTSRSGCRRQHLDPRRGGRMYGIGTKSGDVNNGVYTKTARTGHLLRPRRQDASRRRSLPPWAVRPEQEASVAACTTASTKGDDNGLLASWDRTLSEISDKLWVAIDYQGGRTRTAPPARRLVAFAKNVSVILGYDIYKQQGPRGGEHRHAPVDINFP